MDAWHVRHSMMLRARQVFTRKARVPGMVDAIISQDAGHEVRSAVRVLLSVVEGTPLVAGQERIRIDDFLRDDMP